MKATSALTAHSGLPVTLLQQQDDAVMHILPAAVLNSCGAAGADTITTFSWFAYQLVMTGVLHAPHVPPTHGPQKACLTPLTPCLGASNHSDRLPVRW